MLESRRIRGGLKDGCGRQILANPMRFLARRAALCRVPIMCVTNPLIRWSWTTPATEEYLAALTRATAPPTAKPCSK